MADPAPPREFRRQHLSYVATSSNGQPRPHTDHVRWVLGLDFGGPDETQHAGTPPANIMLSSCLSEFSCLLFCFGLFLPAWSAGVCLPAVF